jgi:hypothetical protein
MVAVVAGWAFAAFLYFKIAFEAGFHSGISLVAALILGILFGVFVFAASGAYAFRLFRFNIEPGRYSASALTLVGLTFWRFLLATTLFGVVARLVVFGFAPSLSREIRWQSYYGIADEGPLFVLIILAPALLHYASCILTTRQNTAPAH